MHVYVEANLTAFNGIYCQVGMQRIDSEALPILFLFTYLFTAFISLSFAEAFTCILKKPRALSSVLHCFGIAQI